MSERHLQTKVHAELQPEIGLSVLSALSGATAAV